MTESSSEPALPETANERKQLGKNAVNAKVAPALNSQRADAVAVVVGPTAELEVYSLELLARRRRHRCSAYDSYKHMLSRMRGVIVEKDELGI